MRPVNDRHDILLAVAQQTQTHFAEHAGQFPMHEQGEFAVGGQRNDCRHLLVRFSGKRNKESVNLLRSVIVSKPDPHGAIFR